VQKIVKKVCDQVVKHDKKTIVFKVIRRLYLELADATDNTLTLSRATEADFLEVRNAGESTKRVHIVGNSHAHSFSGSRLGRFGKGDKEDFLWDSFSLGPLSSIDLLERKWDVLTKIIGLQNFRKSDSIIFPFGETECRWYALKSVEPNQLTNLSTEQLQALIQPFLDASFEIYRRVSNLGYNVIIWSGHLSLALQPREDLIIPVYGNPEVRQKMTWMWRTESKSFADKEGFQFLDFLPLQVSDREEWLSAMLQDEVHLDHKIVSGFLLANLRN
jgi:hypothetical protein